MKDLALRGELPATRGLPEDVQDLVINGMLVASKLADPVNGRVSEIKDRGCSMFSGKIRQQKREYLKMLASMNTKKANKFLMKNSRLEETAFPTELDHSIKRASADIEAHSATKLEVDFARKNGVEVSDNMLNGQKGKLRENQRNYLTYKDFTTFEVAAAKAAEANYRAQYKSGLADGEILTQFNGSFKFVESEVGRILGDNKKDKSPAIINAVMVASGYGVYMEDPTHMLATMHGQLDEGKKQEEMEGMAVALLDILEKGGEDALKDALPQSHPIFHEYDLPW